MGYLFATGPCTNCGNPFSFNPDLVPSYQGRPICETCIERINIEREELGMQPVHIYPGTYDIGSVGPPSEDLDREEF